MQIVEIQGKIGKAIVYTTTDTEESSTLKDFGEERYLVAK